ncbi:DUF3658 domain-containing protein [Paenibacillus sp. EC2-1]|uniref:DUF3658 domain-containing protein n=1 Tax=Paenibacillus sp. EC2-1 TaxID=3388665 RepID=UPI003BEF1B8F
MSNPREYILEQAKLFVRAELQDDGSGHDWWHIVRVTRTACLLAMIEGANVYICELAALLHDIADEKLNASKEAGIDKVNTWLVEAGVEADEQEHVLDIISSMSFGNNSSEPLPTLEGRIVQDADRLDAIGAIGIARTFTYSGWKGQAIYDPELRPRESFTKSEYRNGRSTSINHFYEKLLKLKSMMNTDGARILAEERHDVMKRYLWAFDSEWGLANESYIEESLRFHRNIKRLHIVFDASTLGSLRFALQDHEGEIPVMLEDNLMIGPLPKEHSPQSTNLRLRWFCDRFSNSEERDSWMERLMRASFDWEALPRQFAKYPIVIWAGDSAPEQCGLRRFVANVARDADIQVINATKILNNDRCQYIKTGEIPQHKLVTLLDQGEALSVNEKEKLAYDWHCLTSESTMLRVLIDGELQNVPESYFDHKILEAAFKLGAINGHYCKSARIIGEVIGYTEQSVTDSFIEYRVRELISEGMLQVEGEQRAMRYYSISLTERGLSEVVTMDNPSSLSFVKVKEVLESLVEMHFEQEHLIGELRMLLKNDMLLKRETEGEHIQVQQIIERYQDQSKERGQLLEGLAAEVQRYYM